MHTIVKEVVTVRISTTQENLAHGLAITSRISSRNVNLPILQNVLLKADGKVLRLLATNLEIAVSAVVRGKIDEGGEFTVPAKLFAEYVSLLPREKVDLELVGNTLRIKTGTSETKIHGIPATEFPVIPQITGGRTYKLPVRALREAIGTVLFAAAQNEARPELTGVAFSLNHPSSQKNTLTLAATDSYRLGEVVVPLLEDAGGAGETELIVPARTLGEVARILGGAADAVDAPEQVTVTVAENQVAFLMGNAELQSRLIEGAYPDYRQIIPVQFRTEAVLSREEFTSAIRAASLFTKAGLHDVRLEFVPKGPLVVRAADAQTGEHRTEVSGTTTGVENHVVLNYKYLLDGLGAIRDDEVVLRLIDGANPCLLTPKTTEERYRYLIMPIKQ